MSHSVEISKNLQYLVWRSHLLSDLMQSKGLDDLTLEPVLDLPEARNAKVKFNVTEVGIGWEWANWEQVEISASDMNSSKVRTCLRPGPPEAHWQDFAGISEVDVTFRAANGMLARARVDVPELADFGRHVSFAQLSEDLVRIRVAKTAAATNMAAHWLLLSLEREYRPKGVPFAFPGGALEADVPVPDHFFGILAVVADRKNRRQVIGTADFNSRQKLITQSPNDPQLPNVRRWIEHTYSSTPQQTAGTLGPEEWIKSWPSDSQRRLTAFYQRAKQHCSNGQIAGIHDLLCECPTGLARYLMLSAGAYESANPHRLIRQLNPGSLESALDTILEGLGSAFAQLIATDEKAWVLAQAGNPNVLEAIDNAANEGVRALDRALHLAEKHSEAIAAWQTRSAHAA